MNETVSPEILILPLNQAHEASALRQNLSHHALIMATVGSGSYIQAITAALMTLGGTHAPLVDTCRLLQMPHPEVWAANALAEGRKIPGWGNGFVKDGPDPLWQEVDRLLHETASDIMAKVEAVTHALHGAGKRIYPNPSCYTAAVAITLGLPAEASPYLFIAARLPKWTQEFCRITGGGA